jgi:hypothetical protein
VQILRELRAIETDRPLVVATDDIHRSVLKGNLAYLIDIIVRLD